jgi:hypothetical protein
VESTEAASDISLQTLKNQPQPFTMLSLSGTGSAKPLILTPKSLVEIGFD